MRSGRVHSVVAVVVLAGVALATLPVAGAAARLDEFTGTWLRAERERDDAARDAMIVRVTEPMSFAFRGFARRVMRKRMVPGERYVIEQGAGVPRIRNDKGVEFPLDGRPHGAGDREVTSRLSETGEIEQVWKEGSDSHGVTTWRIEDDGRLVVSQHVIDPHFAAPLEYSTTYRRER
jgi:hypothetical protein